MIIGVFFPPEIPCGYTNPYPKKLTRVLEAPISSERLAFPNPEARRRPPSHVKSRSGGFVNTVGSDLQNSFSLLRLT